MSRTLYNILCLYCCCGSSRQQTSFHELGQSAFGYLLSRVLTQYASVYPNNGKCISALGKQHRKNENSPAASSFYVFMATTGCLSCLSIKGPSRDILCACVITILQPPLIYPACRSGVRD